MDVVRVLHRGFCDLWNIRLLETDEFRWLERWLELQAASKPPNQLFFFHGWEGPMLKLIAPPAADCFYALSLNVAQSKRMREHFRQALTHTVPSPESPEASSSSTTTRKRSCKPEYSSSSEDETPAPYQESGTSGLEEQREFIRGCKIHQRRPSGRASTAG
ncbi:hypothetical protein EPR50_G00183330 [Perca flavescens]|uniref:Uncharacterized protein n=1 Tax=Perca flavescens TaxID=8167 RepID=A0A484CG50_PERFV|nr:hypothetical protein EPR50_G00183330 [Perca flavescens]